MRTSKGFYAKAAAGILVLAMVTPGVIFPFAKGLGDKKLTEEQKIAHVLNRLGFGARPGDIEKVKAMGLEKYLDQQLSPSSINDAIAASMARSPWMSSSERIAPTLRSTGGGATM